MSINKGVESMNIVKEITERRSIRKYKSSDISSSDLLQILEASRLAPSGSNTQPWRFIIIRDEDKKKRIAKAEHEQNWMLSAPVFLACISDTTTRFSEKIPFNEESPEPDLKLIIRDSSIAISYILLEAQHLGIGSCWTGWFNQSEMKEILGLPEYMYVNGIITLGYADESPKARPRIAIEDLVKYEKW